MAHFAKLDENNTVLEVHVVNNCDILDETGQESEEIGVAFLKSIFGEGTHWKQTSYNGSFRKNYAGIGYKYSEDWDAFIVPKPFDSWLLNDITCRWVPPVLYPTDGKSYIWDENTQNWIKPTN